MIRLEGVTKLFGDKAGLHALNLNVPSNCLYGLVGPPAAGKSLVLKVLAGLVRTDAGRVVVAGQDIAELGPMELEGHRRRIGMLFQNNALFDFMSVAENVAFPLRRLFDLSDEEVSSRVSERLQRVGLPGFEERSPTGLSGGQKKRVGIARATVTSADLLLYDEPAAGLDPVSSQRIFELLRREQRDRKSTVVMVSSDIDRLLTVTDLVGVIHRGQLIFEGSTDGARESRHPVVRQFLRGLTDGPL